MFIDDANNVLVLTTLSPKSTTTFIQQKKKMDGEKLPYQKTFLAKLISTSAIEEREKKKRNIKRI